MSESRPLSRRWVRARESPDLRGISSFSVEVKYWREHSTAHLHNEQHLSATRAAECWRHLWCRTTMMSTVHCSRDFADKNWFHFHFPQYSLSLKCKGSSLLVLYSSDNLRLLFENKKKERRGSRLSRRSSAADYARPCFSLLSSPRPHLPPKLLQPVSIRLFWANPK